MRPLKRIAITAGTVIVVGVVALVARTLVASGVFVAVTPGFGGSCRTLTGIVGAEDIAIDRRDRLVFLSATDRRATAGKPSRTDGLYTLPLDHPEAGFTRLAATPGDFHPHGIGLFRAADGSLTLMAVNHMGPGQSAIDIFEVAVAGGAATLREIGAIQSDRLVSPNDIAAVGKGQFYVTNDHGSRTQFGTTLETYLLLPRANVLYFDGSVFKEVATGLVFANGIALSPDGNHLYVAETSARRLQTFARDAFSGKLTPENSFALPSGPDNIDVDDTGALWIAGHPNLIAFLDYVGDPSKPSPSQILKVTVAGGIPQTAEPIYTNPGREIGASSVGAVADGHLFIGSVFDPKVLDCRLP